MYLTTTVSVALVLCLVGLECILLLSANTLITRVKENVAMTIVLNGDADSTTYRRMDAMLSVVPYTHSYQFISQEQALQEHIEYLGEDPTQFLGYNPLRDSYELHLKPVYVQPDSMEVIEQQLNNLPYVERVIYQKNMMEIMNHNLSEVTIFLLLIALILFFISEALIVNTVRLQIYSKRFLINTMSLVGATAWMIKKPFVRQNILMGFLASLLAIAILAGGIYYLNAHMGVVLFALTWQNIAFAAGVVMAVGILITLFASLLACGKYIRMKEDTMYTI